MNKGAPIIRYQDIGLEQYHFESMLGGEHLLLSHPHGLLVLGSDCVGNAVLVRSP